MESALIRTAISQPQCPLILADWQDDLSNIAQSHYYEPSKTVQWFHDSWYRFGKSSDLIPFILLDEKEGGDGGYMAGLFATIVLTGIVLLVWMVLIVTISHQLRHKLPTKKKQSDIYRSIPQGEILLEYEQDEQEYQYFGRPLRKPLPPREPTKPAIQEDQEVLMTLTPEEKKLYDQRILEYNRDFRKYQTDVLGWKKQYANYKRKIRCSRMTVVLSCLLVILSSTLFYINGAKQLIEATKVSKQTLAQLMGDTQLEMDRIQGFLEYSRKSNITTILDHTNTYCPLKRPRICSSSMMLNDDCDWTGIPYRSSIQTWTSALIHYQTNLSLELYDFQQDLQSGKDEMDGWISSLNHLQNGLQTSSILVFLLDALCVYILVGVAVAVSKQRHIPKFFVWIRSYALIPLFVIVIVCGWIFASSFTLASLTTSDFCAASTFVSAGASNNNHNNITTNEPTTAILALLRTANLSPILEELIRQYVTGCSNAVSQDVFGEDLTRLVQSVRDAKLLQSSLIIFAANDGSMKDSCGPFSESILSGTAHMTQEELCTVADWLHETRVHMACSAWDPIYTQMTQQVLCTDAMDAFAWITISQLVIVFVSMLILTFRVAILPVQYVRWQPLRAKALSKQVTADLKKMSGLAARASQEKLHQTKIEPIYHLGYASSRSSSNSMSGTAESVSDIFTAEASTAEPSYSDSNTSSLQTHHTTGNIMVVTNNKISPKMLDEEEEEEDVEEKPGSDVTLITSSKQTAAPIMAQSIEEVMDEDNDDEQEEDINQHYLYVVKKPESESMRSESIPPASERSMTNDSNSVADAPGSQEDGEADEDGNKKPESYSMSSDSVPVSLRSMTSAAASEVSSVNDAKPQSAIRILMEKGASVRHKSVSDDSSFDELTIKSDSEFEEATYYSKSSHHKKSSTGNLSAAEVISDDADDSKRSNSHHSDGRTGQSRMSGHSQRSDRFLSSLEDVAEESLVDPNNHASNNSKVSPFAPGNAFMDHLLLDDTAAENKGSRKKNKPAAKHLSLPVELSGKSSLPFDTGSSLGPSMAEDTTSKSMNVDLSTSDAIEASEICEEVVGGNTGKVVDDDSGVGVIVGTPQNSRRKGGMRKSISVKNIEAVKDAEQAPGDDNSFHFSLNLDMETFHSTDFGDFSSSEASGLRETMEIEYEIIEEIILPQQLSARNLTGRSASVSALSVDPDDPAYKSFASSEVLNTSDHGRTSASVGEAATGNREQFQNMHLMDTSAMEANGGSNTAAAQTNHAAHRGAPPRHIDIHALQKRVDSIRSLGSASAGRARGSLKDHNRISFDSNRARESVRSNASTPSIAISAATMDEKHFRLDEDINMRGSGNSFGLPSRAIDSEMLAVVDETWMDDKEDEGRTRGGLKDHNRISFDSNRARESVRSNASTPSLAISAATMDEKHFRLDDDNMRGSGNSFGLPSRAIDSEMLAVVDETWMDDIQDEEQPSSSLPPQVQMKNLARTLRPQQHGWRIDNSSRSIGSGRSPTPANQVFLQRGGETSMRSINSALSDDFNFTGRSSMGSKPQSMRSLASTPSIAISAATLNENHFFLEDDHGGSSDSFGNIMLPSRAIDSEMLEVVDETWMEDLEDQEIPSSRPAKAPAARSSNSSQPHRLPANHIFFQKGADSVRSLGMDSFSGLSHDEYDGSFDKPMKPMSGLSLGTSPSIAISAATMDEKQFRLDDDMGGSGNSFGLALLPSRGMDSAMLEVVDEALAEDLQDTPSNRGKRKIDSNLMGSLQPPESVETTTAKTPKMDSDPSLGEALEKSGEMSLVDPFEKSIEISAAR